MVVDASTPGETQDDIPKPMSTEHTEAQDDIPSVKQFPKKISNTDVKSMVENNASIEYRQDNPKKEGSK